VTGKAEALAGLLVAARQSGAGIAALALAPALVPATADEAYAVQDIVAPQLGRVAGWKVGAPAPGAEPNCAPLFADLMAASPARWPAWRFPLGGIEAEIAFRFGSDLPPRAAPYREDEVWQAVATLHPSIELVQSRFADFRAADKLALLADFGSNGAFCHGPGLGDWRHVDFLRQSARLAVDGKEAASAVGGNAAGHPKRLLAWLVNHRARRGRGLAAGDIVTTGTHTGLVFIAAGATATVHFAGIGEASVTLAA
jgi:2-keto-4-pentenoate hydratase